MSEVWSGVLEQAAVDAGRAIPDQPMADVAALSIAASAKRQADALERIAKAAERIAATEYKGAMLTQRRGG